MSLYQRNEPTNENIEWSSVFFFETKRQLKPKHGNTIFYYFLFIIEEIIPLIISTMILRETIK